jgi:hypothetical protein
MNIFRAIRQLRQTVGLEPSFTDYIAPAVGLVAVGMLAGAGVALLFAPSSGKKLREDMEAKFSELRSRYMLEAGNAGQDPQRRVAHQNNIAQNETYPRS